MILRCSDDFVVLDGTSYFDPDSLHLPTYPVADYANSLVCRQMAGEQPAQLDSVMTLVFDLHDSIVAFSITSLNVLQGLSSYS